MIAQFFAMIRDRWYMHRLWRKNRADARKKKFVMRRSALVRWADCQNNGHKWKSIGGSNAGCELGDDCGCSIPVHSCIHCGDCDYGVNAEAEQIKAECKERLAS